MKRRLILLAAPAIVAAPSLMRVSALAHTTRAPFWDIPFDADKWGSKVILPDVFLRHVLDAEAYSPLTS